MQFKRVAKECGIKIVSRSHVGGPTPCRTVSIRTEYEPSAVGYPSPVQRRENAGQQLSAPSGTSAGPVNHARSQTKSMDTGMRANVTGVPLSM